MKPFLLIGQENKMFRFQNTFKGTEMYPYSASLWPGPVMLWIHFIFRSERVCQEPGMPRSAGPATMADQGQ